MKQLTVFYYQACREPDGNPYQPADFLYPLGLREVDELQLSGEIRWFWKTKVPPDLQEWFMNESVHGCRPGGGPPGRKDVYLIGDGRGELSIKTRGESGGDDNANAAHGCSDVEVKGLVAVDWGALNFPFLAGPVEFWGKWPFPCLDLGKTRKCELNKIRWLRKFDTSTAHPVEIPLGPDEKPSDEPWSKCPPILGCNVELTEIRVSGLRRWFSFCIETFGDRTTIADDLRAVVTVLSRRGGFPDVRSGLCLNYPSWISQYVAPGSSS